MNKAVILDLDGTLMETIDDIKRAVNILLTRYGFPQITSERAIQIINHGAKQLVKDAIGVPISEKLFNEYYKAYQDIYFNLDCSGTYVYDGMEEFIVKCKQAGYKVCIATNKHLTITERLCKEKLPNIQFDAILGVEEGVIPKPDPTYTLKMLKQIGVEPKNAYFIGDGDTDVLTAINTGTKGISVLWGYRNKQVLQDLGATMFAQTPADLFNLIKF